MGYNYNNRMKGGEDMELRQILKTVDHTLLSQTATWEGIQNLCDEAVEYQTASVCIPASYVRRAAEYLHGRVPVCTVIGFPNGYDAQEVKCFAAEQAVRDGASEIDMVVNLGWVRDGKFDEVLEEIRAVKKACGEKILKVIIETCLLTREEKIELCRVVSESGADFIKTSTGFSAAGATFDDVALMAEHVTNGLKIKAAGGISSLTDAEKFLELGASRLGTSRIVKIAKQIESK